MCWTPQLGCENVDRVNRWIAWASWRTQRRQYMSSDIFNDIFYGRPLSMYLTERLDQPCLRPNLTVRQGRRAPLVVAENTFSKVGGMAPAFFYRN